MNGELYSLRACETFSFFSSLPSLPPNRFVEQHAHRHRETRFIAAFHPFVSRLFSSPWFFNSVFPPRPPPLQGRRGVLISFFQFESFKVIKIVGNCYFFFFRGKKNKTTQFRGNICLEDARVFVNATIIEVKRKEKSKGGIYISFLSYLRFGSPVSGL